MTYIHICRLHVWKLMLRSRRHSLNYWNIKRIGIFRNLPWVTPGRWGFYILGFEIGSRQPGDPVGLWLRNNGLWPW